ncbi:hypothetical protein E9993_12295 [Labilibacter sediminis]|nr:hypothetical protein E9993_12295 [Labilibacter sediminis]
MVKFLAKLFSLLAIIIFVSCETTKYQSHNQLVAAEMELLDEFLEYVEEDDNPEGFTTKELLTDMAVDTIDHSLESGMIYFEMKTGSGDLPKAGTEVGYRYVSYRILEDTAGIARAFASGSNYYQANPEYFTIGDDASSLSYRGIYPGIVEAITNMRLFGKSTVIIPSPIGPGDYVSRMYELELTYMSK